MYKTRNLLILIEFSSDLVYVPRSKIIFVRERILFLEVTESIYLIFFWKRIVSFKPRNLNSIPIEGRVFKCILTCISKLSTILLRFVHIWSMFTMTYFGGRKNNRPPGKFSHYLVIRYGYLSNSWMKILKVCKQKNYESTTNLRYLCGWLHCQAQQ